MEYRNICKGTFINRPNRFIAVIDVDGEPVRAHVKNTGRCRELLLPDAQVYLQDHSSNMGSRKLRYSLIAVEKRMETATDTAADTEGRSSSQQKEGAAGSPEAKTVTTKGQKRLVNLDSQAPNKVVKEALESGALQLPEMERLTQIKGEQTFGASRFDFYVEDAAGKKGFIEVKGVTLEEGGVAAFPDAPTERGVKHVEELVRAKGQGYLGYVLFVIQMKGVHTFRPNDRTHRAFGDALRNAAKQGIRILAIDCMVGKGTLQLDQPVPVVLGIETGSGDSAKKQ